MKFRYFLFFFILLIFQFSFSIRQIELFQQRESLMETETVILAFSTKNINIEGFRAHEEWCYNEDVFINDPKEFISHITLKDDDEMSFVALENLSRKLGGNYLLVQDLEIKANDYKWSEISADVFYVADTKGYEKKYSWTPDRELIIQDFTGLSNSNHGLFLEENYTTIKVNEDYSAVTINFENIFFKSHFSCVECDHIDLVRENLKFDMIELCYRLQTQAILESAKTQHRYFSEFSRQKSEKNYPYLRRFRKKIDAVNNINELSTLNHLQADVTKKIEALDQYSHKTFTVLNKKKPK